MISALLMVDRPQR